MNYLVLLLFEITRLVKSKVAALALLLPLLSFVLVEWSYQAFADVYLPGQGTHLVAVTIWPYSIILLGTTEFAHQGKHDTLPLFLAAGVGRSSFCLCRFMAIALHLGLVVLMMMGGAFALARAYSSMAPLAVWSWASVCLFLYLLPCVGFGMFWGIALRTPGSASIVAISVYMLSDLVKNRLGIDGLFFSSLLDQPFSWISDAAMGFPMPPPWQGLPLVASWIMLSLGFSCALFSRTEIQ